MAQSRALSTEEQSQLAALKKNYDALDAQKYDFNKVKQTTGESFFQSSSPSKTANAQASTNSGQLKLRITHIVKIENCAVEYAKLVRAKVESNYPNATTKTKALAVKKALETIASYDSNATHNQKNAAQIIEWAANEAITEQTTNSSTTESKNIKDSPEKKEKTKISKEQKENTIQAIVDSFALPEAYKAYVELDNQNFTAQYKEKLKQHLTKQSNNLTSDDLATETACKSALKTIATGYQDQTLKDLKQQITTAIIKNPELSENESNSESADQTNDKAIALTLNLKKELNWGIDLQINDDENYHFIPDSKIKKTTSTSKSEDSGSDNGDKSPENSSLSFRAVGKAVLKTVTHALRQRTASETASDNKETSEKLQRAEEQQKQKTQVHHAHASFSQNIQELKKLTAEQEKEIITKCKDLVKKIIHSEKTITLTNKSVEELLLISNKKETHKQTDPEYISGKDGTNIRNLLNEQSTKRQILARAKTRLLTSLLSQYEIFSLSEHKADQLQEFTKRTLEKLESELRTIYNKNKQCLDNLNYAEVLDDEDFVTTLLDQEKPAPEDKNSTQYYQHHYEKEVNSFSHMHHAMSPELKAKRLVEIDSDNSRVLLAAKLDFIARVNQKKAEITTRDSVTSDELAILFHETRNHLGDKDGNMPKGFPTDYKALLTAPRTATFFSSPRMRWTTGRKFADNILEQGSLQASLDHYQILFNQLPGVEATKLVEQTDKDNNKKIIITAIPVTEKIKTYFENNNVSYSNFILCAKLMLLSQAALDPQKATSAQGLTELFEQTKDDIKIAAANLSGDKKAKLEQHQEDLFGTKNKPGQAGDYKQLLKLHRSTVRRITDFGMFGTKGGNQFKPELLAQDEVRAQRKA